MKLKIYIAVFTLVTIAVPIKVLSSEVRIGGVESSEFGEYDLDLAKALAAVEAWWADHGCGFKSTHFRKPGVQWSSLSKSFSPQPNVVGFAEDGVAAGETQWFATAPKVGSGPWKLTYPSGDKYSFEWYVAIVNSKALVVEVRIVSPMIDWIEEEPTRGEHTGQSKHDEGQRAK